MSTYGQLYSREHKPVVIVTFLPSRGHLSCKAGVLFLREHFNRHLHEQKTDQEQQVEQIPTMVRRVFSDLLLLER